jgi:hypothetical protein
VQDLWLDQEVLEVNCGGSHEIRAILRVPTEEEQKAGHQRHKPFYTVIGSWKAKEKFIAIFNSLASQKMPKGSKKDNWNMYGIDQEGNILQKMVVPLHLLPEPFISFVNQVEGELSDYVKRTINILRWRCGVGGGHNPFSHVSSQWSLDGQNWESLPSTLKMDISGDKVLIFTKDTLSEIEFQLNRGLNQPLGRELYLEAWEQRHQNPRSSLIVGIAAAETGLKHCISSCVPDAKWLIENVASPDLVKMLSGYLPLLPTKNRVNKNVFAPGSYIYETLRKGVYMRNEIVHGKGISINHETLKEILLVIRNVLWILDYCSGYDWALSHVHPAIGELLAEQEV